MKELVIIPKIVYTGFNSYLMSEIFIDQDLTYITDIHENDGSLDSSLHCIFEHFGIKVIPVDFETALKPIGKKLENDKISIDEVDFKSLLIKTDEGEVINNPKSK